MSGELIIDPHIIERLHDIQIRLARSDDAKARSGAVQRHFVQLVRVGKFSRGIDLVFIEPFFLLHRGVGPTSVNTVRW